MAINVCFCIFETVIWVSCLFLSMKKSCSIGSKMSNSMSTRRFFLRWRYDVFNLLWKLQYNTTKNLSWSIKQAKQLELIWVRKLIYLTFQQTCLYLYCLDQDEPDETLPTSLRTWEKKLRTDDDRICNMHCVNTSAKLMFHNKSLTDTFWLCILLLKVGNKLWVPSLPF